MAGRRRRPLPAPVYRLQGPDRHRLARHRARRGHLSVGQRRPQDARRDVGPVVRQRRSGGNTPVAPMPSKFVGTLGLGAATIGATFFARPNRRSATFGRGCAAGAATASALRSSFTRTGSPSRQTRIGATAIRGRFVRSRHGERNQSRDALRVLGPQRCKCLRPRVQRFHFPGAGPVPGQPTQRSVSPGSGEAYRETNDRIRSPSGTALTELKKFGEGLHPLQDSWSQQSQPGSPLGTIFGGALCDRTYSWGHSDQRGGWREHDADLTFLHDPNEDSWEPMTGRSSYRIGSNLASLTVDKRPTARA